MRFVYLNDFAKLKNIGAGAAYTCISQGFADVIKFNKKHVIYFYIIKRSF